VAIGRAIVRKPKVFLFDEPLSNLDAALRVNMRIELSRLHKELGSTMIYVTHDQVEAMTMGDRIAVFNKGHIEQLGAPLELYNQPANEFVAGFLGAPRVNMVDRPSAAGFAAHDALWAALAQGAGAEVVRVGLRPEHLHVVVAGEGIPAKVELAEHLGDVSILHLRVEGAEQLLSAKVAAGHRQIDTGHMVGLRPDARWVMRFDASAKRVA
jgi:multiple sugar transport system ATP-binding protein